MLEQFIMAEWQSILAVIVFAVACVVLVKRGYSGYVSEVLFYLVTEAERQFGSGTGELKYAAVTTWAYGQLPTIVKILFTPKQVDRLIEAAVDKLQLYLEENASARKVINSPSQPYINC